MAENNGGNNYNVAIIVILLLVIIFGGLYFVSWMNSWSEESTINVEVPDMTWGSGE